MTVGAPSIGMAKPMFAADVVELLDPCDAPWISQGLRGGRGTNGLVVATYSV